MLADTSVWVEHLRRGNAALAVRLEAGRVLCHPFVIGELACGHLRRRGEILSLLAALPGVQPVEHEEAMAFTEAHQLMGAGLGWIDVHLLASCMVSNTVLWTLDRRLGTAARRMGLDVV